MTARDEFDRIAKMAKTAAELSGARSRIHLHAADEFMIRHLARFNDVTYHHANGNAWIAAEWEDDRCAVVAYSSHHPHVVKSAKEFPQVAPEAAAIWIENRRRAMRMAAHQPEGVTS